MRSQKAHTALAALYAPFLSYAFKIEDLVAFTSKG